MHITFKKQPNYSGRMRLAPSYAVNVDGKRVATIQGNRYEKESSWFWYGDGQNSCATPATLEECKAAVREYFRSRV